MEEFSNPPIQPSAPSAMPARPSKFKKVFLWTVVGVLAAIAIAIAIVWMRLGSGEGVMLTIQIPDRVQIGVPFTAAVHITNESNTELGDARVSLSLPADIAFVGSTATKTLENKSMGTIAAGAIAKQEFQLIALSTKDAIKQLRTSVSYIPGSLSSRFEKTAAKDIVLEDSAILLDIQVGSQILSGEAFTALISYENIATKPYENVTLRIIAPAEYTFTSSEPEAQRSIAGGRSWQLGTLEAGERGEIMVRGTFSGPASSAFDLRALVTAAISGVEYSVSDKTAAIAVARSPLALAIELEGGSERVLAPGEGVRYTLRYINNTDIGLRDAIISAKLDGEMFDLANLQTNGVLRGSDNTIIWNASRVPELANIPPGKSGSVSFTIRTKNNYPITDANDKNFTVSVKGEIESPTVPRAVDAERTVGFASLTSKIRGQIDLAVTGFHKEPTANVTNSGPIPPKVGQGTTYTIHWKITNYSTDVANVRLKAFLGPNVRFTGVGQSSTGVLPRYNERTQEVAWDIPKIAATKGVIGSPTEAVFQVELVPSIGQVGKSPTLIEETSLTAEDSFTGVSLSATDKKIETNLTDDSSITGSEGRVAE